MQALIGFLTPSPKSSLAIFRMLMGHIDGLPRYGSAKELLLSDPTSEQDGDEEAGICEEILYMASFEDLAAKYVLYDTIIWVSISLLLVLAWGIGVFMLLYLPMRRHVLQKDISSRKLYVTPDNIVYKVSRPSFIPFCGVANIEKHVPLSLVIDIIIEQGCLQSVYGLHTFRVESIARGKAAAVDELQVQGVSDPVHLRKVIINEASKVVHDVSRSWKTTIHGIEGESMARTDSLTEVPSALRSPSKNWKMVGSPRHASVDHRGIMHSDLLMNKIEDVNKSVKRIELLLDKSRTTTGTGSS